MSDDQLWADQTKVAAQAALRQAELATKLAATLTMEADMLTKQAEYLTIRAKLKTKLAEIFTELGKEPPTEENKRIFAQLPNDDEEDMEEEQERVKRVRK